jgi:hypothetical protein
MRKVWQVLALMLVLVAVGVAAGCGGSKSENDNESALNKDIKAVCDGSALTEAPKLPASFPVIEEDKLTYTKQSTEGPTNVIEGYFNGDVQEAHDEFLKELKAASYDILFNEVEAPDDSEISWKGEGRTGQVAMRNECGESDKTYVHITNRPA